MTDFYGIKFKIESKLPNRDSLKSVIVILRQWLVGKYGVDKVENVITDWNRFYFGDSFGSTANNELKVESSGVCLDSDGDDRCWACIITEYPKSKPPFSPRIWFTEVGYEQIDSQNAYISYSVKYEDDLDKHGRALPWPNKNVPNAARAMIESDEWSCTVNGSTFGVEETKRKIVTQGLLGIDECRNRSAKILNRGRNMMEKQRISLCRVNKPDINNTVWLYRIADLAEGIVEPVTIDRNLKEISGNRRLIYRSDGPDLTDSIGFWEWTDAETDDGRWRTSSKYLEDIQPYEVIIDFACQDIESLVEHLKSGIEIPQYIVLPMFVAVKQQAGFEGILCDNAIFSTSLLNSRKILSLKENISSLPTYQITDQEIISWEGRTILKRVEVGEPTGKVSVTSLSAVIKQLFMKRLSWPIFKAQGITKSDWKQYRDFLDSIPDSTFLDELSAICDISHEEAEAGVKDFLTVADKYINAEDIDADIIVNILNAHSALRNQCDLRASELWKKEHSEEIQAANKELEEIRNHGKAEIRKAEDELSELKENAASAISQRDKANEEVFQARQELEQIKSEITHTKALGDEVVVNIQKKIEAAQKDMAGFISDISVFLPHMNPQGNRPTQNWNYISPASQDVLSEKPELSEDWKSEFDTIFLNFSNYLGVPSEMSLLLTSFLYSAMRRNIPVMVAGPAGEEIADVLSSSIYGTKAGRFILGNTFDSHISDALINVKEQIVVVSNMFGAGWSDTYPQLFGKTGKQIIWTHPYVEDILIEPKGLLNYMVPILSETFLGEQHPGMLDYATRSENFKSFQPAKARISRVAKLRELKLSRLCVERLESLLGESKTIMADKAKEGDIEILFGVLPAAVLTGQVERLREIVELQNLSGAVKEEITRYLDEE